MSPRSDRAVRTSGFGLRDVLGYVLVAGAVWLGWEAIKAPLAERGAPALAVRLAPTSAEVLRRAAEAELVAKRFENAQALADESLGRAPFNAGALRVRGLAEARLGDNARADEMLTLAGNWSLRDDPAHAWLIENRLRRGDYRSAFAHADTLARRRPDLYPSLFRLFTAAAVQDPRALPVIAGLLASNPPWRLAFLEHLHKTEKGAPVVGGLALALQRTKAPFTDYELQRVYEVWVGAGRFQGIRELRRRLGRPPLSSLLQSGTFETAADDQIQPFGWTIVPAAGISGAIVEDDLDVDNRALRVEYDGFASGVFIRQVLLLTPGRYVLVGQTRSETPMVDTRLAWRAVCAGSGRVLTGPSSNTGEGTTDWKFFRVAFTVPHENCQAQWLQLAAVPGDRRTSIAAWFDNLGIRAVSDKQPDAAVATGPARRPNTNG